MSDGRDVVGSLFDDDEPARKKPEIVVRDEGLTAYIIIPKLPFAVDVRELLEEAGVIFNIDNNLAAGITKDLFDGRRLEPEYLLAKGKEPVDGQDGELILRTKKPEDVILSSEDLTQVDYRVYKRKMLALAEEDRPVAMVISPTKGFDGMDVYGNVIPGRDGKEVELRLGQNVERQGRKLISKIDGLITYKKNNDDVIDFDISEVYYVDGDVDFRTGNVDFPGSVMVKGVIKAGFEVTAKNEVVANTIRGKVVAGGSVVSKQGIIGGTKMAEIKSGGSVYAKFMQFAEVITGDSVFVKRSILSSVIYAQGEVNVEGTPGSIVGGNLYVSKGVEAKVLGSESYVKTEIAVYTSAQDVMLLRNVVERRFEVSKTLTKIDTYLGANRNIPEDDKAKRDQQAKLMIKREQLRRELLEINKELKSLQKLLTKPVDAVVHASKRVWPEVRVSLSGKYMLIKNEKQKSTFFYDKAEETIEIR